MSSVSIAPLDADKPEGNFFLTDFTFMVTRSGDLLRVLMGRIAVSLAYAREQQAH